METFKTKRIKMSEVKVGMKIKTMTPDGEIVFREITDKFDTPVLPEQQVRLEFENDTVINCSTNHPILVQSDSGQIRVNPMDLTVDDQIITDNGLTKLKFRDLGQNNNPSYLDITVDDTHVFFTSESKEGPMVLTKNSQGGIRNASCTVTYPIWHYQFEDLIVLKNNQGTEETRVRQMDYSVVVSKMFWNRYKNGETMSLFDPAEVPDLYEAYYRDSAEFEKLYLHYEKHPTIKKKVVSTDEIFKNGILKERTDTGRIYLVNIDNVINQGPFDTKLDPIYQSNLCQEILLPTRPFQRIEDPDGRISLCTLGSINWGAFRNPQEMRKACRILVRSLSNLLQYQDFLSIQSKLANTDFEPLGVGITNLAYWHAKRNFKYGEANSLSEVKRWMEHQAFYLTETSVELAQERGPCGRSQHTYYGKGIFPWERRAAGVNELTDFTPSIDWEPLRERMKKYGIRNATLMAVAPVESSSVVLHSTNGLEMPMELISVKESKAGSFVQVVPEYKRLKNRYQLMWDQKDCVDYLKTSAVLGAYIDQSLSTNTFYSPKHFKDGKIPGTLIAKNLMLAYKWGIKTLYYSLLDKTGSKHILTTTQNTMVSEPVKVYEDEEDCSGCKL
jgi:ribonucleoside-diphosphate reductase alpha chain